jgi:hypothetical protein
MKVVTLMYSKGEEIVGTITGSVVGYIAHKTFADIIVTCIIAILTGFLGGAGAHAYKLLKAKISAWRYNRKLK